MDISKLPWKAKKNISFDKDEIVLWHTKHHWVRYLVPALISAVIWSFDMSLVWLSFTLGGTSTFLGGVAFFLALILFLVVLHWFFHAILSESLCDMILTKKRMIYITHSLWVSDLMHDISLTQVKAVEAHQTGIVQHLFDYGEIWFDTGGSSAGEPNQTIAYVPKPQKWATEISRAMKTI